MADGQVGNNEINPEPNIEKPPEDKAKMLQEDPSSRYLAYESPKGDFLIDMVYDKEGSRVTQCTYFFPSPDNNHKPVVKVESNSGNLPKRYIFTTDAIINGVKTGASAFVVEHGLSLEDPENPRKDKDYASAMYDEKGRLMYCSVVVDKEGSNENEPKIAFTDTRSEFVNVKPLIHCPVGMHVSGEQQEGRILVLDEKSKEQRFEIEWGVIEEDVEGRKNQFFFVVQTGRGIKKTFRVSMSVNMDQLRNLFFSKPPYPINPETGKIDHALGKIDSLLAGAGLKYSYQNPPEIQKPAGPNIH